jgi:hypothetical protein
MLESKSKLDEAGRLFASCKAEGPQPMTTAVAIKIFDVLPGPDESWVVLLDGQPLTLHQERKDAVSLAHAVAIQNAPARLVIHAIGGFIESDTPYVPDPGRNKICETKHDNSEPAAEAAE